MVNTQFALKELRCVQAESGLNRRERAIAMTKLEEALMWLEKLK
jgi:hypothetical protein